MVLLSFLFLYCVVSLVQSTTLEYTFKIGKVWRGTWGGSPGEQEAGGVRETGEERAGGGISTGSLRREAREKFKKAVKETNPTTFLDFHLSFPRLKAKFYTREKSKNENKCSG